MRSSPVVELSPAMVGGSAAAVVSPVVLVLPATSPDAAAKIRFSRPADRSSALRRAAVFFA